MKYEYKVLKFNVKGILGGNVDENPMEVEMNELCQEGWRLVNVERLDIYQGGTAQIVLFFERPSEG